VTFFLAQTSSGTSGVNFPTSVLSLMVWIALAFAIVMLFLPDRTPEQRSRLKTLTTTGTGGALFFALWAVVTMAADASTGGTGGQPGGGLLEQHGWLKAFPFSASYYFDNDGVTLALALLGGVVFFCAALAAWRNERRVKLLGFSLLTLETAYMGVISSYDWILFLFFWSLPLVPVYLLVHGFGHGQRARAATRYAVATLVSTGLLTMVATLTGVLDGNHSLDMGSVPITTPPGSSGAVAFWLMTAAFLLAMAVVPLHGALLDLQEDGQGVLGAVFGGLLPNLGAYGLLHLAFSYFPKATSNLSLFFAALAVVTVVWSALAAFGTDDLRRLVGHLGNAMMGLVLLAIAGHTTIGVAGAMFILLARGIAVSLLMLLASGIQERTRRIRISQLGGLAWQAPHLAAFWGLGILTAAGAPLLAGFFGYWSVLTGSFPVHRWATVIVLAGNFAVVGAMLRAARRVFAGAEREGFSRLRDLGPLELTYLAVLGALSLFLGVVPSHFTDVFMSGASSVLSGVGAP
jgi:NADH-quinone oxidoreductase subunit M